MTFHAYSSLDPLRLRTTCALSIQWRLLPHTKKLLITNRLRG